MARRRRPALIPGSVRDEVMSPRRRSVRVSCPSRIVPRYCLLVRARWPRSLVALLDRPQDEYARRMRVEGGRRVGPEYLADPARAGNIPDGRREGDILSRTLRYQAGRRRRPASAKLTRRHRCRWPSKVSAMQDSTAVRFVQAWHATARNFEIRGQAVRISSIRGCTTFQPSRRRRTARRCSTWWVGRRLLVPGRTCRALGP